ncbi:MAG: tetratricopeptide repeat protein [candidate division Zixibacteria bacterium]|nr:tetratricopeptide repeat protein [candidate division Zixibacteria bacterium]
MKLIRTFLTHRYTPWGALVLAAVAGATFRYALMDRLSPREFSYFVESCMRFRYAEMRMLGREPPKLDRLALWPEGFPADRMILTVPDRTATLFYKLHRGDTFLATRALINVLSAASVVAFVALAYAVYRRPWPAAAATLIYAGTFGAYSRGWSNFLREDFAMPGLLVATAATLYLLTSDDGRRRWLVAGAGAAATLWAGSCWHMSQFYVAVLALFVVAYGVAGRPARAAFAGAALAVGLAAAAVLNKPLWVKGALWNVGAALAAAPVAAWALAKMAKRADRARWLVAGAAVVLVASSLAFGRSPAYGHVFELIWAKVVHLGKYPGPAALSPEARLFWVGPYQSPDRLRLFIEYGPMAVLAAAGLILWWYHLARRRLREGEFVAAAAPVFIILYLLISRLTIFLAPWVALLSIYPAAGVARVKARLCYALVLIPLWGFHIYTSTNQKPPEWFRGVVASVTGYEPEIPWYYGSERVELLLWMARHPSPGPVLADFSLSPPYLYLAGWPIALNPMFEVPEVRRKALAYAEAAVADEETFYRLCRRWGVKYVVHFAPQVLSRGTGSFYNATAREPGPNSAAALMQFHPEKLRRFRLVLETYNVRVFEVGRPYDGFRSRAYHPLYDPGRFGAIPKEEALKAFYRDFRRADYYYNLGRENQAAGDYVAAAAAFASALRLHPDFEDATLRLGQCQAALGQYDEARTAFERAAVARPGDPRPREYLKALKSQRDATR